MSSCCKTPAENIAHQNCPECGIACLSVAMKTIWHQVQYPDNQYIPVGDYAYCANPKCLVAYFSLLKRIPKSNLNVFKGGQDAMLCYCFDISTGAYQCAIQTNESVAIKAFVVQQTKAGICACDIKNPSGRCCLGDFKKHHPHG